jgi:GntR family transcriptional regulator
MIERLVLHEGVRIGLAVSYVGIAPDAAAPLVCQAADAVALLDGLLDASIDHAETTVATVPADAETAVLLGIAEGTPMLWLEEILHDRDGRPCAIKQLRYRGDRVAFSGIVRRRTNGS